MKGDSVVLLRNFALAAGSLFAIVQAVKLAGGNPLLPFAWQDIAMPIGAAAIFVIFRGNRRGGSA